MVVSDKIGRNIFFGGGLSILNMFGSSYHATGESLSQSHVQVANHLCSMGMYFQQKKHHDNEVPMLQSQHFSMRRLPRFNLGIYLSLLPHQWKQHTLPNNMPHDISLRTINSLGAFSSILSYEKQFVQQHQLQFRLQQMPSINLTLTNQSIKSMQFIRVALDLFGLLCLLSMVRSNNLDIITIQEVRMCTAVFKGAIKNQGELKDNTNESLAEK